MHDYLLHEVARIRIEELREEAARARATRGTRKWRHHLGLLAGAWAAPTENGGLTSSAVDEACCA
jgi:hypothetical protein